MNKIIYILIVLAVFTISVSAETGTINVTSYTDVSPYGFDIISAPQPAEWSKLYVYVTGYNSIARYRLSSATTDIFPAAKESDSTTFTCLSGCTGYGYVEWSKASKNITWTFNNDFRVTASQLSLSYVNNIFSGFNNIRATNVDTSLTKPIGVSVAGGLRVASDTFSSPFVNHVFFIGVSVPFQYNVTYANFNSDVLFTAFIDKSGTGSVTSKIKMHSQTIEYFNETTFNTVNVTTTQTYLDGLYINFTLSGGGYHDLLINNTGTTLQPTPTPVPPVPPVGGAAIAFNQNSYVNGQTATISYNFDPSIFNFLFDFNIKLRDSNNNIVQEWHNLPTATGNVQYTFIHTGTYTADLIKSCFLCSDTILGTDSTIVTTTADQPTTNSINSLKTTYNTSESVYIYGTFYPKSNEQSKGYVTVTVSGTGTVINRFTIDTSSTNAFNFSSLYGVGGYTATLQGYLNTNDCAGTTGYPICYVNYNYVNFNVINSSAGLSIEWITDGSLPNSTTKLNTFPSTAWTNATANDIVTVFDNSGVVYKQFYINNTGSYVCPTCYNSMVVQIPDEAKYIGTWHAQISNGSNVSNIATAYLNVISASSVNFTNDYGVSMYWDKSIGTVKDTRYVIWTTGTYIGNYQIKIVDGLNGNFLTAFSFTSTGTKTQQTAWTFAKSGEYAAQFIDSNNSILASAVIKITSGVSTTVTPGISGEGVSTGQQKASDIANLLDSNLFWALMFTVGLMIAVAIASRRRDEE